MLSLPSPPASSPRPLSAGVLRSLSQPRTRETVSRVPESGRGPAGDVAAAPRDPKLREGHLRSCCTPSATAPSLAQDGRGGRSLRPLRPGRPLASPAHAMAAERRKRGRGKGPPREGPTVSLPYHTYGRRFRQQPRRAWQSLPPLLCVIRAAPPPAALLAPTRTRAAST